MPTAAQVQACLPAKIGPDINDPTPVLGTDINDPPPASTAAPGIARWVSTRSTSTPVVVLRESRVSYSFVARSRAVAT